MAAKTELLHALFLRTSNLKPFSGRNVLSLLRQGVPDDENKELGRVHRCSVLAGDPRPVDEDQTCDNFVLNKWTDIMTRNN